MKLQELQTGILIIGAGPAGLAAASAALSSGKQILIADDNPAPGGQIWRGGPKKVPDTRAAIFWDRCQNALNVQWLHSARLVAFNHAHEAIFELADKVVSVRYERLILCNGGRELLLPFDGWTLPGVTGAGGLQALIKAGADVRGKRIVIVGTGPLLLAVAETAHKAGAEVLLVAEAQPFSALARFMWQLCLHHRSKATQAISLYWSLKKIPYLSNVLIEKAVGDTQLTEVHLRRGGELMTVQADMLACGFGITPNTEIARLLGCNVAAGVVTHDDRQCTSVPHIYAAGEITGFGGVEKAIAEGHIAGLAASDQVVSQDDETTREHAQHFMHLLRETFAVTEEMRQLASDATLVCRCEDVSLAELRQHDSWRAAKLVTRAGMGACQGRICGAACQTMFGWDAPELRQPVFPCRTSTLAAIAASSLKEAK